MKKPIKIITVILCVLAMAAFAACTTSPAAPEPTAPRVVTPVPSPTPPEPTPSEEPEYEEQAYEQAAITIYDRDGFPFTIPAQVNTIISIGPSNTEVLVELGFVDAIIQTDRFSSDVPGISEDIATLDMMSLDLERIISLNPCIVFVTGMTRVHGEMAPLAAVSAVGITVAYMPSSASIAAIKEDILFMAAVVDATEAGEAIVADMTEEIDRFRALGDSITERPAVYFEISPAPFMFSFGSGTFLHEMIELVGGTNVFGDQEGWLGVADEVLLALDPDVIFTSTDFIDDPIGEIKTRSGWDSITAVQNGDVFVVDTSSSNRPNHNIVIALREIAAAIHPDEF